VNVGGLLLILISVAFDALLVMLGSARLSAFVPMYHGSGFCCPQLGYVFASTDSEGLVKGLCAVWCLARCQGGLVCMVSSSARLKALVSGMLFTQVH